MKNIFSIILFSLCILSANNAIYAQCCSNCPADMPDNSAQDFYINLFDDPATTLIDECDPTQNPITSVTLNIDHEHIGDITITLTNPLGTSVTLMGPSCGGLCNDYPVAVNGTYTFTDSAPLVADHEARDVTPGSYNPYGVGTISSLNIPGGNCGTWVLNVSDGAVLDVGVFNNFGIPGSVSNFVCNTNDPPPGAVSCGSSSPAVCYGTNSTLNLIGYTCPAAGQTATITFTQGQVEDTWDELRIFSGTNGNNTDPQVYTGYGTTGDLTGLVQAAAAAGECLSVYVDADGSATCSNQGYTPTDRKSVV